MFLEVRHDLKLEREVRGMKWVRCSIQRERHEQMWRGLMCFRSEECNWEIIGKEGAGRRIPDQ